jgi:hypothetical protein
MFTETKGVQIYPTLPCSMLHENMLKLENFKVFPMLSVEIKKILIFFFSPLERKKNKVSLFM